jgi:hypothetical protein
VPRYALIDNNSGFVWSIIDADDPGSACIEADRALYSHRRRYEMFSPYCDYVLREHDGYLVHEVPPEMEVDDGQDAAAIQLVEAHPRVAVVRCLPAEDEEV